MTDQNATATPHAFLNAAQIAVLETYAGGDFAHMVDCPTEEAFVEEGRECGDGLLRFLMVELDKREDCTDPQEALRRVRSAISDLEGALQAIEGIEDVPKAPSESANG